MTYKETLAKAGEDYRDVLDALAAEGLRAECTQSGGMCGAIVVPLDGGYYILFTDLEDTLSWDRDAHVGWWCGLYEPEERRTADGPLRWLESEDGSPEAAVRLAGTLLRNRG